MQETTQTMGQRILGGGALRTMVLATLAILVAAISMTISAQDAQAMTNDAQRAAVLKEANRINNTNIKYKMGFPDPCNYTYADCECFNRLVYKKANIALKSTLWGQISQGRFTGSPQKGDLIFFDSNRNGQYGNDYDHTGIYMGRNASGQRMVMHSINYPRGNGTVYLQTVSLASQFNGPVKYVDVISYK